MEAFAQHQALQVEMSDSQTIENVDSALAKLPQLDQNILLLRFYHGLSFREIGKQLGKSEDASQKLSSRALEKLGRVLQGRGLSASVAVVAATLTAEFAKAAPVGVASKVAKGAIASAPTLTKVALTLHTIEIMNYAKTKFTAVLTTFSIASITIIWLLSNTTAQEEIKGKAKARQPVWVASIKFVERLEVDYRFALIFIGPEIQFSRRTPPVKNWFLNLKTTTGDGRFTLIKVIPPGEDPVAAPGQVVLIDNFRVDGNPLKLRCGPVVVRPEYQARIRNKATGKEVSVRLNEQFRLPGVEEDLTVSGISEDSVEISFPEKDGKERRKIILKK